MGQHDRPEIEPLPLDVRQQSGEQRDDVRRHAFRRQPIADDDDDVRLRRQVGSESIQVLTGRGAQLAAEIGPAQIRAAIARRARDALGRKTERIDLAFNLVPVERRRHRIARLGVRQREGQHLARRHCRSRPAKTDAGVREAAQIVPGVGRGHAASPCACCSSGLPARGAASLPVLSVTPMRSSQASNSGARFRPSASRT